MRKGRRTGSPVSVDLVSRHGSRPCPSPPWYSESSLPGCRVESTIFFACHISGVISLTWPVLYATMAFFARSSPCLPTKSVLQKIEKSGLANSFTRRARTSGSEANKEWLLTAIAETIFSITRARGWFSHLGSVMPAVCLARPQYVLRSYCDSGNSRLPGREADMVSNGLSGWRQKGDGSEVMVRLLEYLTQRHRRCESVLVRD